MKRLGIYIFDYVIKNYKQFELNNKFITIIIICKLIIYKIMIKLTNEKLFNYLSR